MPRFLVGHAAHSRWQAALEAAAMQIDAQQRRIALLCYERDARQCHRSLLIDALLPDFAVVDLEPGLG